MYIINPRHTWPVAATHSYNMAHR